MKKLQYRVIAHEGYRHVEYKQGWFGYWTPLSRFDNEDKAIHFMLELLERKRKEREESKKKVIAQETV